LASQKSFYYRAERIHGPCVLYAIPSHPVEERCSLLSIPGGASLIDQLALLEKKDALIALGFVNIPRETQTAIQYAKKIGSFVFGITDLPTSFIAKEADICLYAKRGLHTTVNTLVPAFSLVNALTIALGQAKTSDSIKALKDLDDLYETYLK